MEEAEIKTILKRTRFVESDIIAMQALHKNTNETLFIKRVAQQQIIYSWLCLLDSCEYWIIKQHLIDGLPWPLVTIAFAQKWGNMQARDERTLKRIQSKSIRKISSKIKSNNSEEEILDLFEDILFLG